MTRVSVTYNAHVAHVELTRPDKRNAMDSDMIDAIIVAGLEVSASDARAVVLSGAGEGFCAGLDVASFASMAGKDPYELIMPRSHGEGTTNRWQEVAMVWDRCPIPVIAALHGTVFGAGFQLAMGADIRFCAPSAKLSIMEMKWGLIPDMGGMVLLPRLAREDVIKRMTYTATPIAADQALKWGLVTELADDPVAAAKELAGEIAGKSPSAVRAAKALVSYAYANVADEVLVEESRAQASLVGGADQMEVIAAQMQGRPAVFK